MRKIYSKPVWLAVLFGLCLCASLEAAIPVNQWVGDNALQRRYPEGLTSLVQSMNRATGSDLDPSIQYQEQISAAALSSSPILYVNAGDIDAWPGADRCRLIRDWVDHGGFLWIDAGLQAPFLQETAQTHSYASWDPAPGVAKFLRLTFGRDPEAIPADHPIFRAWFSGLPDTKDLSAAVKDYVVNEKWPNGTYSLMGLRWGSQFRVILSPIISMGWGRTLGGDWVDRISFRIREYDPVAERQLSHTVAKGRSYEVSLASGQKEIVYCESGEMPSWVREPTGRIRLFKYYNGGENNDFAHVFYTQLGINILYYGLMLR